MIYKFFKGHAMNDQNAFATQARQVVPRVAETESGFSRISHGLLANLGVAFLFVSAPALAGPTYLGTAQNFAVLGASAVTSATTSIITGDLGIAPGLAASVTGILPADVSGTIYAGAGSPDPVAAAAQTDLTTAYNTLASQTCTQDLTGTDLGGLTLTPGVYCFSTSAQLTGTLTLNAQSNPNAVFIFKMGSTLTTASGANVSVINGNAASSCGVSWQVGSSATLGTTTAFLGNIVALTSITLNNGASVTGRVLARNGAVTLDNNTVSSAACDGAGGYTATGLPGPGSGVPAVATSIPTLSEWAMIMLVALLAVTGFVTMRRQTR